MKQMIRPALGLVGLVLLAAGGYLALAWAPRDGAMGDVQRIMYAHVPAVWVAMVALVTQFCASVYFLMKGGWKADALAEASTEVGVFFGTVGVVLGSIWGRPTWGVWWTWDPRLTTAAILIASYFAVIALRKFVADPERRASWAAVASIIAFVDVPIVWFSVRWWRSLHQVQSTTKTVDPDMGKTLAFNGVALLLVGVFFIWTRYRTAMKQREAELTAPDALPPLAAPTVREVTP